MSHDKRNRTSTWCRCAPAAPPDADAHVCHYMYVAPVLTSTHTRTATTLEQPQHSSLPCDAHRTSWDTHMTTHKPSSRCAHSACSVHPVHRWSRNDWCVRQLASHAQAPAARGSGTTYPAISRAGRPFAPHYPTPRPTSLQPPAARPRCPQADTEPSRRDRRVRGAAAATSARPLLPMMHGQQ